MLWKGRPATVLTVRMAAPAYGKAEAYSIRLHDERRDGYRGTTVPAAELARPPVYFIVTYRGFAEASQHLDYNAARDAVTARYPKADIGGHDGDIENGGAFTWCWETEDIAVKDRDGSRAIATITKAGQSDEEALREYRVTWTIDVEAVDEVSAARRARRYQLNPAAQVGVFEVTCKDGHTVRVDLDEEG